MTFRVADLRILAGWGQLEPSQQRALMRALDESYAEVEQLKDQIRELEAQIAERRAAAGGAR